MWKKIKLLEYHSDLLTMTVDIHLGICDVGSLKEDFFPRSAPQGDSGNGGM